MQLLVLYQPKSEFARVTEDYIQDFKRLHPDKEVVLMDVESVEGTEKAKVYDVLRYPALLALANDSTLQNAWSGEQFPLMDEVAAYL